MRLFKRTPKINQYFLTLYVSTKGGGDDSCVDMELCACGFHVSGYGRVFEFFDEGGKIIAIYPTSMTAITHIEYDIEI
jgi:hypothetical protein